MASSWYMTRGFRIVMILVLVFSLAVAVSVTAAALEVEPAATSISVEVTPAPPNHVVNDGTMNASFRWTIDFESTPDHYTFVVQTLTNPRVDVPGTAMTVDITGQSSPVHNPGWTGYHAWLVPLGQAAGTYIVRVEYFSDVSYESSGEAVFYVAQPTPTPTSELIIFKYEDLNGNGAWDQGEPGLEGWEFAVTGPESFPVEFTDGNGLITLSNILIGDYTVTETLKSGWSVTTPPGSPSLTQLAAVTSDGSIQVDFGNRQVTGTPLPDLVVSSLSGEWVVRDSTYTVTFTVCNIGTLEAGASVAAVYIDGVDGIHWHIGPLGAGECSDPITLGPFSMSDSSDDIEVRADDEGAVEESNEENNTRQDVIAVGGGCFIATAALGPDDSGVETLRTFRDSYLLAGPVGSGLVSAYYKISPPIAQLLDDHPALKPIVRAGLLPAIGMSKAAVSMTLGMKASIVGSIFFVGALTVAWQRRRVSTR